MNKMLIALGIVLLIGGSAYADWYGTGVVTTYYPSPVLVAPAPYVAPVVAPVPVVRSAYYAPVVVARPRAVVVPAAPVYAPVPAVYSPAPAVYAAPVVVRPKVYIPGRPVRNAVRAVVP